MMAHPHPADDLVDLRWLALDAIALSDWPGLQSVLDLSELRKADSFHFERDRQAYVAAHALARRMLAGRLACPVSALRFTVGPFGKPELDFSGTAPPVQFSLSHTAGFVVAAVTGRHAVGVDAEAIVPGRLETDLAMGIFTPDEVAQLRQMGPAQATDAAFALWTLKEAFAKATGLGLHYPFDSLSFTLDPPAVHFRPLSGGITAEWLLRCWQPTPVHALALAMRHPRPGGVRVDCRAICADELTHAFLATTTS